MNYPLDVEVCVKAFMESEGYKDTSVRFLRAYVAILNDNYKDGLNNGYPGAPVEPAMLRIYEKDFKEVFGENYSAVVAQLKEAYTQGQAENKKMLPIF